MEVLGASSTCTMNMIEKIGVYPGLGNTATAFDSVDRIFYMVDTYNDQLYSYNFGSQQSSSISLGYTIYDITFAIFD
jgi:hypothetical protein